MNCKKKSEEIKKIVDNLLKTFDYESIKPHPFQE